MDPTEMNHYEMDPWETDCREMDSHKIDLHETDPREMDHCVMCCCTSLSTLHYSVYCTHSGTKCTTSQKDHPFINMYI